MLSAISSSAIAQSIYGDRFVLNTGRCTIRSGVGSPGALGGCDVYIDSSSGAVFIPGVLTSPGDITLDPSGNDVIPAINYDINLGSLQRKFLTLHAAELWVETLVAQDTLATIGGRVLVAPTNILTANVGTGDTSITVKYNNFASGDRVYMEAAGKVEFFAITSTASGSAGAYVYSVTRNLDGSGANLWDAGDAMLNTGTTGNGFIDLYSVRGVKSSSEIGPTIVGNVRNSTTYNDWSPRWAIGNLNGLYGYATNIYGAAFGVPSGSWIKIDPTNGVRIGNNTTTKISLDASGNASFAGDITATSGTFSGSVNVGTGGALRSNSTAFMTGTGFWLAYNAGNPQFHVGNPSANYMSYDTTTGELKAHAQYMTISNSGIDIVIGANSRTNDKGYTFSGGPQWLGMYANTVWSNQGSLELVAEATTNNQNENDVVISRAKTHDAESYVRVEAAENQYNPVFDRGAIWMLSSTEEIFMTPGTVSSLTLDAYFEDTGTSAGWGTNWHKLAILASDERLKRNLNPLRYGMKELRNVQPISFTWRSSGVSSVGFSAQNVRAAGILEAAPDTGKGYYGFSSHVMLATAVNAIKNLDSRIARLEAAQKKAQRK